MLFFVACGSGTPVEGEEESRISLGLGLDGQELNVEIQDYPEEEILEALRSGFRTEVLLQIRVYRPSPILPGLLPDLLQDEHEVVHVATWDPFQLVYTLDSSFSGRITFSHPFLLMVGLTRLRGFPLPILRDVGPEEARHILVRARVSPVKLRPPLNILTLFNFSPYHQSSWTRLEYQIGGGEP